MSWKVFLAYPLQAAEDLADTERLAQMVRQGLEASGYTVRPGSGDSERAALHATVPDAKVRLGSNVAGVTGADFLVVLLSPMREPSSIWVEVGMALAVGRPVVLAGPAGVEIPFLVRLAVHASRGGSAEGPRVERVVTPAQADVSVEAIVARLESIAVSGRHVRGAARHGS